MVATGTPREKERKSTPRSVMEGEQDDTEIDSDNAALNGASATELKFLHLGGRKIEAGRQWLASVTIW